LNYMFVKTDVIAKLGLLTAGFATAEQICGPVYAAATSSFNDIVPTIVPTLSSASIDLSVTFAQPATTIYLCGESFSFPASSTTLNNTGNASIVTPAQARGLRMPANASDLNFNSFLTYTPAISWSPTTATTKYILLMIDPLFINGGSGYFLHMMITNITGSNVSTGKVVARYLGPSVASSVNFNKYTFVLYEQPAGFALDASKTAAYMRRVGFNLTTFINDNVLEAAVGLNYMFVKTDAIAKLGLLTAGFATAEQICGVDLSSSSSAAGLPADSNDVSFASGMYPNAVVLVFAMSAAVAVVV